MSTNGKLVVIADDHETSVMYFSLVMRRLGFSVIPASNGEQVLEILETVRPDLIITDQKMPRMDGITLLKHIKANDEFHDIPVIVASAYVDQNIRRECLRFGAAGVLSKPIQIMDLHQLIQENVRYENNKKRNHLRYSYGKKVQVGFDGIEQEYFAVTLSEGGIFLRSSKPLPVGTRVYTYLELQDGQHIQVCGSVIYQTNVFHDISRAEPGMAVKFEGLTEIEASMLKSYIMEMLAGDLLEEQREQVISSEEMLVNPINSKSAELDLAKLPMLVKSSKALH